MREYLTLIFLDKRLKAKSMLEAKRQALQSIRKKRELLLRKLQSKPHDETTTSSAIETPPSNVPPAVPISSNSLPLIDITDSKLIPSSFSTISGSVNINSAEIPLSLSSLHPVSQLAFIPPVAIAAEPIPKIDVPPVSGGVHTNKLSLIPSASNIASRPKRLKTTAKIPVASNHPINQTQQLLPVNTKVNMIPPTSIDIISSLPIPRPLNPKELAKLTEENTLKNSGYQSCVIQVQTIHINAPRPPSPSAKLKSQLCDSGKNNENEHEDIHTTVCNEDSALKGRRTVRWKSELHETLFFEPGSISNSGNKKLHVFSDAGSSSSSSISHPNQNYTCYINCTLIKKSCLKKVTSPSLDQRLALKSTKVTVTRLQFQDDIEFIEPANIVIQNPPPPPPNPPKKKKSTPTASPGPSRVAIKRPPTPKHPPAKITKAVRVKSK